MEKIVPAQQPRLDKLWILSLDPFAGFSLEPTLHFARETARRVGAQLLPVYVLAPTSLNWTGDFSGAWLKEYGPQAEAKLHEILSPLRLRGRVIHCKTGSQKGCVKVLQKFAQKIKAECIVLFSHGRQGLERMALGSFAEAMILTSSIPVLVTYPARKIPRHVQRILVPTDLSDEGIRYVHSLVSYAQTFKAEIILYYKQPDPLDPIVQQSVYSLGGGWVSAQNFLDNELERKTQIITQLEMFLQDRGIATSHILDSAPGDLVEGIEQAAEECHADMISVLTHSGSWTSSLIGSVARGLVRSSSIPIWVQR